MAQDHLSRIGVFTSGPSISSAEQMALDTTENPIETYMTVEQFMLKCAPLLCYTWGCDETGALIQIADYRQQIGDTIGIAPRFSKTRVRITQSVGNGLYLAQRDEIGSDFSVFALNLGRDGVADDTRLNIRRKRASGVHTYVTVQGVQKNVAIYDVASDPAAPSRKLLADAFLNGARFRVLMPSDFPCAECKGKGIVDAKSGTFKIRRKCPACSGLRTVSIQAVHEVSLKK
jgi:hypothetical protein